MASSKPWLNYKGALSEAKQSSQDSKPQKTVRVKEYGNWRPERYDIGYGYPPELKLEAWDEYERRFKAWQFTSLLCIFFGLWGVHRIYLKHWMQGAIRFCITLIMFILNERGSNLLVIFIIPAFLFFIVDLFRARKMTNNYNDKLVERLVEKYGKND